MSQHKHHSPQHRLPAGCHDANSAAELLGMSKKALLKRMRELGWLIVGGDAHNLPRREFVQAGYMNTQERGYALKGHQDIARSYRVMLLTQKGFQELKKVIESNTHNNDTKAPAAPVTAAPSKAAQEHEPPPLKPMTPEEREAAEAERDACMEQLKAWGLTG